MKRHQPSRSEFIEVSRLRYHVRHWGREGAPILFLVHGWMDVGASFQFLVDALEGDWHVIAPDWRGYGETGWAGAEPGANGYWFPDYMADLDALLDHFSPDAPVNLLGHSMGGNIVLFYAGIRPERIRRLVNLEGFGMAETRPEQAPARYAKWMDQLKEGKRLQTYATVGEVAERLRKSNPRLTKARAEFLAPYWSRQLEDGRWEIRGDPAHKLINPILYQLPEAQACWARITAPVLHVEAKQTDAPRWLAGGKADFTMDAFRSRFDVIKNRKDAIIDQAGHMVHHDQPEKLARLVEAFCLQEAAPVAR
ncbi:MAG: alpha/beta hydrolase [Candidatus Protistobacter heckmanni]|nr:alpha/beta hydrolase [Candidatus Protistobacter heckmanni]